MVTRVVSPVANLLNTTPDVALATMSCLNCSAALIGTFCSACGQRAVPASPTLRELIGEALVEFSGWDGKFAATLRRLVWQPGVLTQEFAAGRRARYISPVRLYLSMSLIFFVLAAAAPTRLASTVSKTHETTARLGTDASRAPATGAAQVAGVAGRAQQGTLDIATRDSALASIARAPRIIRPILRRSIAAPDEFKNQFLQVLPRVLFALLPMFAVILGLFYRRQRFPAHLYYALHLHAFVFFALILTEIARFTHVIPLATAVRVAACVWILVYAFVSVRRVYGGSVVRTLIKGAGITALYLVAGIIALSGAAYWTAVAS
jgi:hypothetical protein